MGSLWIVVGRCGLLWVIVGRCGSFRVLVTTLSFDDKGLFVLFCIRRFTSVAFAPVCEDSVNLDIF